MCNPTDILDRAGNASLCRHRIFSCEQRGFGNEVMNIPISRAASAVYSWANGSFKARAASTIFTNNLAAHHRGDVLSHDRSDPP